MRTDNTALSISLCHKPPPTLTEMKATSGPTSLLAMLPEGLGPSVTGLAWTVSVKRVAWKHLSIYVVLNVSDSS